MCPVDLSRLLLRIAGAIGVLSLPGCATTQRIEFLSEPPGARIMVNNDYVGDAPCSADLDNSGGMGSYTVEAYPPPTSSGLQARTKYLSRWEGLPSRVLFDLRPGYSAPPGSGPAVPTASGTSPAIYRVTPPVAEGGSYYGQISETTGLPKTVHVRGYFRKDGTYVQSHYRSRPRR